MIYENVRHLAKKICQTLFDQGYVAYFAGGWVRDLLLGNQTPEIDIATSAPPYVIQQLFPKTVPVGIVFGVVVVVMEGINFEVTTFRKDHQYIDGRHPEGVDFSTPEHDANRRDFTINGMFYDPLSETLYDFVGGQEDLQEGCVRAIGDPEERFKEDRLRMIRAVRFAARFGFQIEEATVEAIKQCAPTLLPAVSIERIWQELSKIAADGHFDKAMIQLHQLGLLQAIFPQNIPPTLAELEEKVAPFAYLTPDTPPILYLMEIFSQDDALKLCLYLKTPVKDQKLVEFFRQSHEMFKKEAIELFDWAHFYAHPSSELFLNILGAKILPSARLTFFDEHEKRKIALKKQIERIQHNKPVVTSSHLIQKGLLPGKKMGLILKKAERIAINENLENPEEILQHLQEEISDL